MRNWLLFKENCLDGDTRIAMIMKLIAQGLSDQDIADWYKIQDRWPHGEFSKKDVRVYRKAYEGKLSAGSIYTPPVETKVRAYNGTLMEWMYGREDVQPLDQMRIVDVQALHEMILERTGTKTSTAASAIMGIGKDYLLRAEKQGHLTARAAALIGDILDVNLYRAGFIERM